MDCLIELSDEASFYIEILRHCLQDRMTVGEVGQRGGWKQPCERIVALLSRGLTSLDGLFEAGFNRRLTTVKQGLARLVRANVEPGSQADLGDTRSYRAEPGNANGLL